MVIFLCYEKTVEYILNIPKFTSKNKPAHTKEFLRRLGNPQDTFAVIHVAGSNGKGSVCAFINSVLRSSNLRVGMFTSPHLTDIRERFQISGELCSKEQFQQAEQKVRSITREMQKDGLAHPTFFEYIFAIGMVIFQQAEVACAVVETGLGGRLDATNIIGKPLLSIITSISLEHTEILGTRIEEIAREKAGIIKQQVPVIVDGSEPLALPVIQRIAEEKQAPLEIISKDMIKILLNNGKNIDFSMDCEYDVTDVRIPFPAEYQVMNAALALAAVNRLKEYFLITDTAITEGFRTMTWWGRMEEVYPEVYLDGAHNVSGIQAFLKTAEGMTEQPSILLFSMVQEKNYREAIRILCKNGQYEEIILTEISNNPRALSVEYLKQCFLEEGMPDAKIKAIQEPQKAFAQALEDKKLGQNVFCIGSLYLVGELKGLIVP